MVNPLELLQAQVDKANYLLKKKKVGATVYIRKDGFFLRAYLPSKTNPDIFSITPKTGVFTFLNISAPFLTSANAIS